MRFNLRLKQALASLAMGVTLGAAAPESTRAQASDPFLGQMMLFGGNFCPRGWTGAEGQLLAISQYSALFSLLGTTFGGDGRTTFGLPDLRGRVPLGGPSAGPGLAAIRLGEKGGRTDVTLTVNELPSHSHMVNANNGHVNFADRLGPGDDFLGAPDVNAPGNPAPDLRIYSDQTPNVQMDPRMISNTGNSQSFNIRTPYLGMTWCIALQGVYPSRS